MQMADRVFVATHCSKKNKQLGNHNSLEIPSEKLSPILVGKKVKTF